MTRATVAEYLKLAYAIEVMPDATTDGGMVYLAKRHVYHADVNVAV